MIREVKAYEAVCDCGCGRVIPLGKDMDGAWFSIITRGWRTEGKAHLSGFCKLPKAKKQRKANP